MQLIQRDSPDFAAQILPLNDNEIITGPMSDCVSVIVLYNFSANRVYQNAKGYHGGGGIDNVNFKSLFDDVPNVHTTMIVVISGFNRLSQYSQQENRGTIREQADRYGLSDAYIQCCHGFCNAKVTRSGNIAIVQ